MFIFNFFSVLSFHPSIGHSPNQLRIESVKGLFDNYLFKEYRFILVILLFIAIFLFAEGSFLYLNSGTHPFYFYSFSFLPSLTLNSDKFYGGDSPNFTISEEPKDLQWEKRYFNLDDSFETILKENQNKAGVYAFRSKYSSNFYIGSSIDIPRRFIEHFRGNASNTVLKNSIKKYRTINFYFYIFEYTDFSRESLLACEQKYLDHLNP
jgi:hypothetical protein